MLMTLKSTVSDVMQYVLAEVRQHRDFSHENVGCMFLSDVGKVRLHKITFQRTVILNTELRIQHLPVAVVNCMWKEREREREHLCSGASEPLKVNIIPVSIRAKRGESDFCCVLLQIHFP
jgi:hypothetical protein